ncbi:MAG: HAMP domain-containing sensor histidine kinase [Acidimicrobiia bacterium]|nr:HAMP domain-containing sensor histidine kinase [Acidimicrobiia bacterium]
MRLPHRDPGSTTGEFRPPEVAEARQRPVRRPMSVGANTDRFLPSWIGSIRFRLALLYSVLLFGLAAIVIGGIYAGISREIGGTIMDDSSFDVILRNADGGERIAVRTLEDFEAEVDRQALEDLRRYSFAALGLLFFASLAVGWYVAGIVLRPIERITTVARSINATDLTRRINLAGPEDELGQLAGTFDDMLDRLDLAFSAQTRFIHEASHELRNPLAVIRTNLEVTLADPNATVDDLRKAGQVVERSADRMATLVDDLLDHARAETRTTRVDIVDLAAVVNGVAEEFEIPASTDGVRLEASADSELLVEGDPVALRRALANLLANAIRLAPEDSVISIRAGEVDDWVWMGVQDQGPGLSATDQQRVFRRFWRGDNTQNLKRDGRSGLGLAIVKQIAETHGGTVRVESTLGEGSTFVIWLRRLGAASGDEQPPSSPSETVVDDRHPSLTAALPPTE